MKHIKLLLTLLVFTIFVNACTNANAFVNSTREMVILSEYGDNETIEDTFARAYDGTFQPTGLGAASDILLTALFQNVPVFTPAALWNTVVHHKQVFDAMATKSVRELKKQYGCTTLFNSTAAIKTFKEQCVYLQAAHKTCMQALQTCSTKSAFKQALMSNNCFNISAAPTSLQQGDWTCWEHIMQYLMCSIVPVERFVVFQLMLKDIPGCPFLLFIPKTLYATLPAKTSPQTNLSTRERALGLKIDHCTEYTNPFTCLPTTFDDKQLDLMPRACDALFVHNNEIPASEQQRWCFYMMGHGIYNQASKDRLQTLNKLEKHWHKKYASTHDTSTKELLEQQHTEYAIERELLRFDNIILGMPLDTAQTLFKFLDTAINTKAFFFTSCSSGGQQALDTFKNTDGSALQLSYPVITDTLAEAPLLRAIPHLDFHTFDTSADNQLDLDHLVDWDTKTIILDTPYDFELLFKLAREKQITPETMDLMLRAFAPTHTCTARGTSLQSAAVPATIRKQCKRLLTSDCCLHTNNHCAIRLPHATTFSLIGPAQIVKQSNTSVINTSVTNTTPLMMLEAHDIPGIILTKHTAATQCPALVSAVPGKACHTIHKVDARDYTLTDIITACTSCEELFVPKMFHIKQLTCRDNCLEHTNKPCSIELYCFISCGLDDISQPPVNHVVIVHNKKTYHYCWKFNESCADQTAIVFDTIADGTAYLADLMQPCAEHTNTNKQFIGNVIDTNELLYRMRSTPVIG